MEEEEARRDLAESPLLAHLVVLKMEDVMDKLKLLDYEKLFCKSLKFRPLPRYYFAIRTNSGEQFHMFTNIAVWLINLCGRNLEQPQEFDDPNATIATIIEEAKKLGISTKFPPMKLKTGVGEQVCNLLNTLCDAALVKQKFSWKKPVYADEDGKHEMIQETEQEVSLSRMEDEIQEDMIEESDEEGDVFLDLATIHHGGTHENEDKNMLVGAMESTVDPEQWKLELERVLPSLKIRYRYDNRDWRVHYEQMHQYHDGIKNILSDTKGYLDKLHQEIAKTLEKISSREKYINQQLEGQVQTFRTTQDQLAQVREKFKQGSTSVNDLAQELNQISSELETIKTEMDERGTSMTDAGPVVRIKQGLTKLKNDCSQMEVQIGLLEHSLLEARFKTKSVIKLQMNAGSRQVNDKPSLF